MSLSIMEIKNGSVQEGTQVSPIRESQSIKIAAKMGERERNLLHRTRVRVFLKTLILNKGSIPCFYVFKSRSEQTSNEVGLHSKIAVKVNVTLKNRGFCSK